MSWREKIIVFISEHRWAVALTLVGILLFILILTINFWRTLLLVVIVSICLLLGILLDKGGWDMVKQFFDRFLPKR